VCDNGHGDDGDERVRTGEMSHGDAYVLEGYQRAQCELSWLAGWLRMYKSRALVSLRGSLGLTLSLSSCYLDTDSTDQPFAFPIWLDTRIH
jgi:hypothetical protein